VTFSIEEVLRQIVMKRLAVSKGWLEHPRSPAEFLNVTFQAARATGPPPKLAEVWALCKRLVVVLWQGPAGNDVRFTWTVGVLVVAIVVSRPASGDAPRPEVQISRFRTGVDVVSLNVTVTDGLRRYISDLGRDDFQIFEDGRKQELTFFQKTGLPLALVFLLDTSASMQASLPVAQEAAIGFARELGPADLASVIDFDTTAHVLQSFTSDRSAIERAIRSTEANGSTALYNAVYIALRELSKTSAERRSAEPRRQAIVLLSDGDDTTSLFGFDEVLDLVTRSDSTIYAIGLGIRTRMLKLSTPDAQFVLRRLAEQTGGRTFFPLVARELATVYAEIRAELSSQYSLAYESTNTRTDGRFRHVTVRLARPGLTARTRPGYYAPTR
jgi:Ca-activated chloride channel family protein